MTQRPRFSELCAGDRILVVGYILGSFSSLLIGVASILKMMGDLPGTPILSGSQQPIPPRPTGGNGRGYFDHS